ncbi:hypothetical protein PAPHI01_1269 [Pancytospora philotis]|nr:hypothetical protein PAPHI01_1269 [Pancytospora philotis]
MMAAAAALCSIGLAYAFEISAMKADMKQLEDNLLVILENDFLSKFVPRELRPENVLQANSRASFLTAEEAWNRQDFPGMQANPREIDPEMEKPYDQEDTDGADSGFGESDEADGLEDTKALPDSGFVESDEADGLEDTKALPDVMREVAVIYDHMRKDTESCSDKDFLASLKGELLKLIGILGNSPHADVLYKNGNDFLDVILGSIEVVGRIMKSPSG